MSPVKREKINRRPNTGESRIINFTRCTATIETSLFKAIEDKRGTLISRSAFVNAALQKARKLGVFEEIIYELMNNRRHQA